MIACARDVCRMVLTARQIRRGRRYCSSVCGTLDRSPAFRTAVGRKGGLAGAKTKQVRAMRNALAKCGGQTSAEARAYRIGYDNGYTNGQKTGEARGYRKAWAEICGETRSA